SGAAYGHGQRAVEALWCRQSRTDLCQFWTRQWRHPLGRPRHRGHHDVKRRCLRDYAGQPPHHFELRAELCRRQPRRYGLLNGDMLTGGLATTATTTSNVGSYGITQGSLAATSNYTLSYVGANL